MIKVTEAYLSRLSDLFVKKCPYCGNNNVTKSLLQTETLYCDRCNMEWIVKLPSLGSYDEIEIIRINRLNEKLSMIAS